MSKKKKSTKIENSTEVTIDLTHATLITGTVEANVDESSLEGAVADLAQGTTKQAIEIGKCYTFVGYGENTVLNKKQKLVTGCGVYAVETINEDSIIVGFQKSTSSEVTFEAVSPESLGNPKKVKDLESKFSTIEGLWSLAKHTFFSTPENDAQSDVEHAVSDLYSRKIKGTDRVEALHRVEEQYMTDLRKEKGSWLAVGKAMLEQKNQSAFAFGGALVGALENGEHIEWAKEKGYTKFGTPTFLDWLTNEETGITEYKKVKLYRDMQVYVAFSSAGVTVEQAGNLGITRLYAMVNHISNENADVLLERARAISSVEDLEKFKESLKEDFDQDSSFTDEKIKPVNEVQAINMTAVKIKLFPEEVQVFEQAKQLIADASPMNISTDNRLDSMVLVQLCENYINGSDAESVFTTGSLTEILEAVERRFNVDIHYEERLTVEDRADIASQPLVV